MILFSKNWSSFYACRVLVAIAWLSSAIGYFILHRYVLPERTVRSGETTVQEIRNIVRRLNVTQQELVPPLENQLTNDDGEPYCRFEIKCKIVRCSRITGQLDPGEVTKAFIDDTFKVECRSNVIASLILERSTFPDNELQEMWLRANVTIERLTLADCSLTALSDGAFSSTIYNMTKELYLLNNNIYALRRATFRHLLSLQRLEIEGNEIKRAEKDLLTDVADTLQCLKLENTIRDVDVLRNITGGNVLPQLRVLSLRYNHIPIIDSRIFAGTPGVISLYLSASHVRTVYGDTFGPISRTMRRLLMSGNNISTLPEGLFDSIIQQNPNFALTIDNNPWHCDCSLKWMQNVITYRRNLVKKALICISPERNAGRSFSEADFCEDATPNTNKTDIEGCNEVIPIATRNISKTSTTEFRPRETIRVDCDVLGNRSLYSRYSRRALATTDLEISLRFRHFSANELENGTVLITMSDPSDVFLIWFVDDARSDTASPERSIRCVGNVRGFFLLRNLRPRTSYAICSSDGLRFSTLYCLSLTTGSSREHRLARIGKNVIIAIFVVSLILMCLLSAVLVFVTVRRHPAMLRGNKRIVIVKRRALDAMVLPRGLSSVNIDSTIESRRYPRSTLPTISRYLKEDGYVTPLPPMRSNSIRVSSRGSDSSVQSDGTSYISGIEPTPSRLNSWRLKRTTYANWESEPPPLPPHPRRHAAQPLSIAALSIATDPNEDGFENLTYAT